MHNASSVWVGHSGVDRLIVGVGEYSFIHIHILYKQWTSKDGKNMNTWAPTNLQAQYAIA